MAPKLAVLLTGFLFIIGGCSTIDMDAERNRLADSYSIVLPAERKRVAELEKACRQSIGGRDPRVLAQNSYDRDQILVPVRVCGQFLDANAHLEQDTDDFKRDLDAYTAVAVRASGGSIVIFPPQTSTSGPRPQPTN
jgi:hypothetical protein